MNQLCKEKEEIQSECEKLHANMKQLQAENSNFLQQIQAVSFDMYCHMPYLLLFTLRVCQKKLL